MGADGFGQTRLTDLPGPNFSPSWSADGKKVAFQSNRATPDGTTDYDVWRVRATDGANPENLTNAPGNDTDPAAAAVAVALESGPQGVPSTSAGPS